MSAEQISNSCVKPWSRLRRKQGVVQQEERARAGESGNLGSSPEPSVGPRSLCEVRDCHQMLSKVSSKGFRVFDIHLLAVLKSLVPEVVPRVLLLVPPGRYLCFSVSTPPDPL